MLYGRTLLFICSLSSWSAVLRSPIASTWGATGCLSWRTIADLGTGRLWAKTWSSVRDLVLQTYAHRIFFLSDDVHRMCNNSCFWSPPPTEGGTEPAASSRLMVGRAFTVWIPDITPRFPGGLKEPRESAFLISPSALWPAAAGNQVKAFRPLLAICLEFRSEACVCN